MSEYWLSWAVRGLVTTATGGDGTTELSRAHQLDPQRTSLLVVLIDAIRREVRFSEGRLDDALPTTSEVTTSQRALWLAIADGHLDDTATATLEAGLRDALGTPDPAALEEWARSQVPPKRDHPEAIRAARTVTVLAAMLDGAGGADPVGDPAADQGADQGDEVGGPTAWSARSAEATEPGATEDPLAELVRSVVDEGAPGESDILDRMAEIRGRMGFVEERDTEGRWSTPVGSVGDLLLADLGSDSTSPGARALARRLLGPFLSPVVTTLLAEAAPAPLNRKVSVSGEGVIVSPDGPVDPTWRATLEQKIDRDTVVSPALRPAGYGALGVGVLGLLLAILAPVWLLLALVGLGVGAAVLLQDRSQRAAGASERARRLSRAEDDLQHASGEVADLVETHRTELATAQAAAARLDPTRATA